MKNTIVFLFALSTIFIMYSGCCKDKDPNIEGCQKILTKNYGPYNLGVARNYLAFAPGSWWVYENDKTGEFDTVIMDAIEIETKTLKGGRSDVRRTMILETINFRMYSTQKFKRNGNFGSGPYINYYFAEPCLDCPEVISDVVAIFISSPIYQVFRTPFNELGNAFYSKYKVKNVEFDSVLQMIEVYGGILPPYDETKFYIAGNEKGSYYWGKNVGLIQIKEWGFNEWTQKLDTLTWNLIDYNVTKI